MDMIFFFSKVKFLNTTEHGAHEVPHKDPNGSKVTKQNTLKQNALILLKALKLYNQKKILQAHNPTLAAIEDHVLQSQIQIRFCEQGLG